MNQNVTQAVARLQARQSATANTWAGDLLDEALDCLLNHPEANDEPQALVRKAQTFGHKRLKRRRALFEGYASDLREAREASNDDHATACEIGDFLRQQPAARLDLLAAGLDADDLMALAMRIGVSGQRIRERISRARAAARRDWGLLS